ncbi:MAG: energy transducer TonB [Bacteroidetes bacterium]|nr:energy transducer TonB [Bacteroidota bacterium]
METKNILAADLLDLLFESRNKDYGAYELRKTYNKRITAALLTTLGITVIALGSFLLANSGKGVIKNQIRIDSLMLSKIEPDEKKIEPPPLPPPKVEQPPVATEQFTPPKIVEDDKVDPKDIPPVNEELTNKRIDVATRAGADDDGLIPQVDQNRQVIETKKEDEDKTFVSVEIEASFPGGTDAWKRYLERHLNPNTPIDNGAPAGQYQVWVQFVVDKEGNISDVKPLTNLGFGMEDEAVKIIKTGPKWVPAIQNSNKVKAYRKQSILFVVEGDN